MGKPKSEDHADRDVFICSYNQSGNRSQTTQTDQNFAESNPSTKIQNPKRHRSSYIYI
jgi:hypothetical protein